MDANLSDDSFVEQQNTAFRSNNLSNVGTEARAMASIEMNHQKAEQFTAAGDNVTTMEGYTNLSLIKEEDFTKHGVGHLQGHKNSTKRIYHNPKSKGQRNQSLN